MTTLTNFSLRRPLHQTGQRESLDWLARVHAASHASLESLGPAAEAAFASRIRKVMDRCACGPTHIATRGHVLSDVGSTDWDALAIYDVTRHPRGKGTSARSRLFAEIVESYFEAEYLRCHEPPAHLIHVTCTGYVSPSAAQQLVSSKGWGQATRVTHAYHMGCYAAFPATRIGVGLLGMPAALDSPASSTGERRADIVHTELCSLHLDPSNHSVEQLVVQSLFADGFIRYSLRENTSEPGLELLSLAECVLPESEVSMGWTLSDAGMHMTLARDVPDRIARALRPLVLDLYRRAGLEAGDHLGRTIFAVHPGGPKIIDQVRDVLELTELQVQTSRDVLFDYGNMSSATLPHIWMRLVDDDNIARETPILSLAFGPGLTVCGGLFRKQ